MTGKECEKMIAEIHLKQIQRRIFFREHVVAFMINRINEHLCLEKISGVVMFV